MNSHVGLLLAITLAVWAVVAYPARVLGGDVALVYSAVAAGLCLAPTVATMLWAGWAAKQSPDLQLITVLGGTGLRMGIVLGVGLLLHSFIPYFAQQSLWVWLLVFYLLTLAVEVVLLVKDRARASDAASAAPGPASLPKNV